MSGQERAAWLTIAAETLSELSIGQIREGCKAARAICRFPSEIVPTVYGATAEPKTQYISKSGYIYKGNDREVRHRAHERADWDTYWLASYNIRVAEEKAAESQPRLAKTQTIGQLINRAGEDDA